MLLEIQDIPVIAVQKFGDSRVQAFAVRALHQQHRAVFHGCFSMLRLLYDEAGLPKLTGPPRLFYTYVSHCRVASHGLVCSASGFTKLRAKEQAPLPQLNPKRETRYEAWLKQHAAASWNWRFPPKM